MVRLGGNWAISVCSTLRSCWRKKEKGEGEEGQYREEREEREEEAVVMVVAILQKPGRRRWPLAVGRQWRVVVAVEEAVPPPSEHRRSPLPAESPESCPGPLTKMAELPAEELSLAAAEVEAVVEEEEAAVVVAAVYWASLTDWAAAAVRQ